MKRNEAFSGDIELTVSVLWLGSATAHVKGPATAHVKGPATAHVKGPATAHVKGPATGRTGCSEPVWPSGKALGW